MTYNEMAAMPGSPPSHDRADTLVFNIEEKVIALGVAGVYFVMDGLVNGLGDPGFEEIRRETIGRVANLMGDADLKQDPVLQGFRDLHTAIGRSNRDNVASPENLLRLLQKNGDLTSINLLVDVYNLVSIESRLALGAHDLAHVDGNIHLKITSGDERFVPLGAAEAKPIHVGEYGYVDDANDVICRMEVRQVEKTKVGLDTTACFYIVQGNAATDCDYLWQAATRLIELTKEYCGGRERILYGP